MANRMKSGAKGPPAFVREKMDQAARTKATLMSTPEGIEKVRISQEEKTAVVAAYLAGAKIFQISEALGLDERKIRNYITIEKWRLARIRARATDLEQRTIRDALYGNAVEALERGLNDEVPFNAARIATRVLVGTGDLKSATDKSGDKITVNIFRTTEQIRDEIRIRKEYLATAEQVPDSESEEGDRASSDGVGAEGSLRENRGGPALLAEKSHQDF